MIFKIAQFWLILGIASAIVQIAAEQHDCSRWPSSTNINSVILTGPLLLAVSFISTHSCVKEQARQ